jgi:PAS domain S-box-containing protein
MRKLAWNNNSQCAKALEDAIIETNLQGRIVSWRGGAESLFGYSKAEVIRRNVALLYPPNLRAGIHSREDRLSEKRVERFDSQRITKDGTPIEVSVILSPVTNDRGQLRGVVEIYRRANTAVPATVAIPSVGVGAKKKLDVVLATAGSGGTIAAVRHLQASGLGVSIITNELLSAAAWSKSRTRTHWAPSESTGEPFVNRLLAIGAANPGQVLLPTSDQTAWLYTKNAELLKRYFCMYQPSLETMERILNKRLFEDALRRAGMAVLSSWTPRDFEELQALAPKLPYPILIKPRTHVHRVRNNKGLVARSKSELIEQYREFVNLEEFRESGDSVEPENKLPVLQQFVSTAREGVCSVTGFVDRSGELFVTRRATKVFQRSQPVGVGVCFESLPDNRYLSNAVRKLCRELNYFGMFEVEFLKFDDTWTAIDFNARLFNQVGMDIRRGMPLPLFACLDAAGETEALRDAVAKAQSHQYSPTTFCDAFTLRAILFARTLSGRISGEELSYWRDWMKRHADHSVDFAADARDPLPGVVHALSDLYLGLKALPRFMHTNPRTFSRASLVTQKVNL